MTTNRATASPVFSSGTPMQAHSITPGQAVATASISFGYTLKPETMIMSLMRSTILRKPFSSNTPTSPVRK
ncbi:hypothetical protein D3C72_2406230 [compost metagenome]